MELKVFIWGTKLLFENSFQLILTGVRVLGQLGQYPENLGQCGTWGKQQ